MYLRRTFCTPRCFIVEKACTVHCQWHHMRFLGLISVSVQEAIDEVIDETVDSRRVGHLELRLQLEGPLKGVPTVA